MKTQTTIKTTIKRTLVSLTIILISGYLGIAQTNLCDSTTTLAINTTKTLDIFHDINSNEITVYNNTRNAELLAANYTRTSSGLSKSPNSKTDIQELTVADETLTRIDSEEEIKVEDWMLNITDWTN